MRLQNANFFSPGTGGLVGDEDEVILDCYRLAHEFHQSPEVFLAMPLSEVRMHMYRTVQLAERRRALMQQDDG